MMELRPAAARGSSPRAPFRVAGRSGVQVSVLAVGGSGAGASAAGQPNAVCIRIILTDAASSSVLTVW